MRQRWPRVVRPGAIPDFQPGTLTDPALYAGSGGTNTGAPLTDNEAKKAATPANVRETPAGQPST